MDVRVAQTQGDSGVYVSVDGQSIVEVVFGHRNVGVHINHLNGELPTHIGINVPEKLPKI
jgi:hypothetical protein